MSVAVPFLPGPWSLLWCDYKRWPKSLFRSRCTELWILSRRGGFTTALVAIVIVLYMH